MFRAVVFCLGLLPLGVGAQSLTIHGLAPYPKVVTSSQIEAIGLIEVKDGRDVSIAGQTQRAEIRYGGVTLTSLLESQGIAQLDRYRLRASSIVLVARDGYQASFSWGELFNSSIGQSVIVIVQENGQKLSARDGDFVLRSFADLRPGPRHVRMLSEIKVVLH
jgi:hypothetical protein